ncbi:MAG: SMP-30/gluconolactonase/LRE family protein [Actinobacteria bacterium]|nr:MAG: SMP-30/gluconolactonase/LRE family protein [Actinomycetota bacterium]
MALGGKWPEPRVLATGLRFPEGPVYLGDGVVAFTEIQGQRISRFDGATTSVVAATGGGANGATLGADRAIYVANNGGISLGPGGYWFPPDPIDGRIQRVTLDGTCADVSGDLPGDAPHRPNDICFGPDGKLYFTDPRNWEDLAHLETGRIWRLDPSTGPATVVAQIPLFCNGLAFGPDPARLYIAQSMAMKIVECEWTPDGLGAPREWAALPEGFPDGFCFSAEGDCYVCGSTADVLQVFDVEGSVMYTIPFPDHSEPTNCCIGDGVLYVTCSGTGELLAFDLGIAPLPLFPFRN